jgi:hypothetical protein
VADQINEMPATIALVGQVVLEGRVVPREVLLTHREEGVAGVTSLAPERADAARWLAWMRGHRRIENQSHGVRDVTFAEDRSQVRCGNIPQVMAALRNTVSGLTRWAGATNMAAACRRFAAQPALALKLIGVQLENCMALRNLRQDLEEWTRLCSHYWSSFAQSVLARVRAV